MKPTDSHRMPTKQAIIKTKELGKTDNKAYLYRPLIKRQNNKYIQHETYFDAGQRRDINHADARYKPTNRSDEA
ncbi:hypothetical protein HC965_16115 [Bacteroides sp. GM023]|nr:hypothetical protein [Bacteroides sp. GM023]